MCIFWPSFDKYIVCVQHFSSSDLTFSHIVFLLYITQSVQWCILPTFLLYSFCYFWFVNNLVNLMSHSCHVSLDHTITPWKIVMASPNSKGPWLAALKIIDLKSSNCHNFLWPDNWTKFPFCLKNICLVAKPCDHHSWQTCKCVCLTMVWWIWYYRAAHYLFIKLELNNL